MDNETAALEQNQKEKQLSLLSMSLLTGFIGGVFWSILGYLAYVFDFTEIRPNIILEPWALGDWKNAWIGTVFAILFLGLVSMLVSLIYYALLKRFLNILTGIIFGIILFLIVFYVLNPIFPGMAPIGELKRDTIITSVCLYILYGVFIGYSISYEYVEQNVRKRQEFNESAMKK